MIASPAFRCPRCVFVPDTGGASKKPALVYLNGRGNRRAWLRDVEPIVKSGFVVLIASMRCGLVKPAPSTEHNATDFEPFT